ncbi:MAG TPA: hypothetical protein V6C91_15750 [Coleofasciculaceae cyanobacterium]
MKLLLRLIQWLLVGLTGFLALIYLANGVLLPFLCFALALIIILPPIEPLLKAKLPFLQKGIVKSLAWFILFNAGIIAIGAASASIADLALCTQLQQGVCQTDTAAFVKNTKKLYLSATPDNIKDGTEFKWELKYTPEPQQEGDFDSKTVKARIKDNKLLLEMEPKELPVGTYQLSVSSDEKRIVTKTIEFTVWDSEKEAQARLGNTLQESETALGELQLCDRSNFPKRTESQLNPTNPLESNPSLQLQRDDPNFCLTNDSTFKSNAKALGFRITINSDSETEESNVKVTWKYAGSKANKAIVESVERLSPKMQSLMYTLSTPDGLPPGDYELIIALETKNAKPVYRQFKVS